MKEFFSLKILDKYIIKKFLTTFVVTLSLFIFIIIVFDISEKLDDFLQKNAPISEIIFKYYINFVPNFLNLFSPVFIFVSVIFFTSKLADKSEIISTLAAGVSYNRFIKPYIITAAILSILSFFLNSYIIPHADKNRLDFENKYIRNFNHQYTNNKHLQIQPGVYFFLEYYGYADSTGLGITLEKHHNGKITSMLHAEKMTYNKKNNKWRLEDYFIKDFINDSVQKITRGKFIDTLLVFDPHDLFRYDDDVKSMDNFELDKFIENETMKGNSKVPYFLTEKYSRYATPFATFILTVIGVCVSSKKTRGGVGMNLGIGIMLSFMYLFLIQYFNTYGRAGQMNPILAVWIPNIIFIFVAYYLYRKVQK